VLVDLLQIVSTQLPVIASRVFCGEAIPYSVAVIIEYEIASLQDAHLHCNERSEAQVSQSSGFRQPAPHAKRPRNDGEYFRELLILTSTLSI
jgi:hypothetical protein